MGRFKVIFHGFIATWCFIALFSAWSFAGGLPSHAELRDALMAIVKENNGGFGFQMWATV